MGLLSLVASVVNVTDAVVSPVIDITTDTLNATADVIKDITK